MPSTFTKSGGADISFRSGPKILIFFVGQLPLPMSTSPERLVGGGYRPPKLGAHG